MGRFAVQALLDSDASIASLRGRMSVIISSHILPEIEEMIRMNSMVTRAN